MSNRCCIENIMGGIVLYTEYDMSSNLCVSDILPIFIIVFQLFVLCLKLHNEIIMLVLYRYFQDLKVILERISQYGCKS